MRRWLLEITDRIRRRWLAWLWRTATREFPGLFRNPATLIPRASDIEQIIWNAGARQFVVHRNDRGIGTITVLVRDAGRIEEVAKDLAWAFPFSGPDILVGRLLMDRSPFEERDPD